MAYYRCSNGGGGTITKTRLWTNPSPSSAFGSGQVVTLSQSYLNFDYIVVTWKRNASATTSQRIVIPTDFAWHQHGSGTTGEAPALGTIWTSGSVYSAARSVQRETDTSLYISAAFSNGSGSSYVVPLYIEGVSLS